MNTIIPDIIQLHGGLLTIVNSATGEPMPHPDGVKAVLAHLQWDRQTLAKKCDIGIRSLYNICNGARPLPLKMLVILAEGMRSTQPAQVATDTQAQEAFGEKPWQVKFPQGVLKWEPADTGN